MEPLDIFISCVQEDQAIGLALADALPRKGLSTWIYLRDSRAGSSYLRQVDRELGRCRAVVLIASKDSVQSHQVLREVEQAHERHKKLLVVRVGLSHEEFMGADAVFRMVNGTTVTANSRDASGMADEIAQAMAEAGYPGTAAAPTGPGPSRRPHTRSRRIVVLMDTRASMARGPAFLKALQSALRARKEDPLLAGVTLDGVEAGRSGLEALGATTEEAFIGIAIADGADVRALWANAHVQHRIEVSMAAGKRPVVGVTPREIAPGVGAFTPGDFESTAVDIIDYVRSLAARDA